MVIRDGKKKVWKGNLLTTTQARRGTLVISKIVKLGAVFGQPRKLISLVCLRSSRYALSSLDHFLKWGCGLAYDMPHTTKSLIPVIKPQSFMFAAVPYLYIHYPFWSGSYYGNAIVFFKPVYNLQSAVN